MKITKQPNTDYSMVENIAILDEYRRQGIAKALCRFVLSMYPNDRYLYQVAKANKESANLALPLDFKFIGGREFVVKWSK